MPAKVIGDWSQVKKLAHEAFGEVEQIPDVEGYDGWPVAPNSMIRQAAMYLWLDRKVGPWTFMENDCIPTRPGWLDEWEEEYRRCGKPFMGRKVPANNGAIEHMTGNAVYPQNTPEVSEKIMGAMRIAFDVVAAPDIVPRMHDTPLIQHVFWYPEYGKVPEYPTRAEFEKIYDPRAVLFHRSKNGDVIRHLREMLRPPTMRPTQIEAVVNGERATMQVIATEPTVTIEHGGVAVHDRKPSVYTYFREANDEDLKQEQVELLRLWKQLWAEAGFNPVVRTIKDAQRHPKFDHWDSLFSKLPTVNPREYEMCSYRRHVAMAAIGGGFLTDYDCFPNGFTVSDYIEAERLSIDKTTDLPVMLSIGVPCALIGTQKQFEKFVVEILMAAPVIESGKPHLSDMHVAQSLEKSLKIQSLDICREYTPGTDAKIIHFSHNACGKGKRAQIAMEFFGMGEGNRVKEPAIIPGRASGEKLTIAKAIEFLQSEAKKSNLDKGRIVKSLRAVGLVPKK